MPLSLEDQYTLAGEAAFRGRIEAALARFAAYQAKLAPGHGERIVAIAEWAASTASNASVRLAWVDQVVWHVITAAVDANLADLAAARATTFDADLKSAAETQIRRAHGVA